MIRLRQQVPLSKSFQRILQTPICLCCLSISNYSVYSLFSLIYAPFYFLTPCPIITLWSLYYIFVLLYSTLFFIFILCFPLYPISFYSFLVVIFSLFLTFDNLVMYIGVSVFECSLSGVLWVLFVWISVSVPKVRKFHILLL